MEMKKTDMSVADMREDVKQRLRQLRNAAMAEDASLDEKLPKKSIEGGGFLTSVVCMERKAKWLQSPDSSWCYIERSLIEAERWQDVIYVVKEGPSPAVRIVTCASSPIC